MSSTVTTPGRFLENDNNATARPQRHHQAPRPTDLCRWSIHTWQVGVYSEPDASDTADSDRAPLEDPDNENSWADWPKSWHHPDMPNVMRNSLESNDFSNLQTNALPMSVSEVLKLTPRAPSEMLREAFMFSIMSRNIDLVEDLLKKLVQSNTNIDDLYPFHLATTYLDGSRTCCNILDLLCYGLKGAYSLPKLQYNDLGHTVMDTLLVSVIKSHTTCTPGFVDPRWAKEHRFPGAEVDICGRWDADSDCIRVLLAEGNPTIPDDWKHRFCHTSAQTIIHCLTSLCERAMHTVDVPSGLFLRRCVACGLKLELQPLHVIIVTSFALAQYGLPGEDLFGMLACLLCLLSNGAESLAKAPLSFSALQGVEQTDWCDHEMLDALELAGKIQSRFASSWSEEIITGWQILSMVLRRSQHQWNPALVDDLESQESKTSNSYSGGFDPAFEIGYGAKDDNTGFESFMDVDGFVGEEEDVSEASSSIYDLANDAECHEMRWYEHENFFGKDKTLGDLWAAVRTEMLTYRRVDVECAWHSTNFDMQSVYRCLAENQKLRIGLIDADLMKEHCRCGLFESESLGFVTMDDVSSRYFANLDDWSRITIILPPGRIDSDMYGQP